MMLLKYLAKGFSNSLATRMIILLVGIYGIFQVLAIAVGILGFLSSFALPLTIVIGLAYFWYAIQQGNTFK